MKLRVHGDADDDGGHYGDGDDGDGGGGGDSNGEDDIGNGDGQNRYTVLRTDKFKHFKM